MSITNTSLRSDRHLGFVFFTSKCVRCQKSKALQGLRNKKIETLSWDFNRCCIATLLIWKNKNLQMSHTKMHIPKTVKPFFPPTRLDYTQLDYLVLVVFYYSWVPSQCALGRYSNMAEGPRTSFVCDTKNTTMAEFKGDSTVYLLLLRWAIVLVFVQPFPLLRMSWLIKWCHWLASWHHAVCWCHIFESIQITWNLEKTKNRVKSRQAEPSRY